MIENSFPLVSPVRRQEEGPRERVSKKKTTKYIYIIYIDIYREKNNEKTCLINRLCF